MISKLFTRSAALFFVSSTFLSTATFAHAETFVLPQQFQHPGLTFSQSLRFDNAKKLNIHSSTIQFTLTNKLSLKDEKKKEQLENIVLAPTLDPQDPTPTATAEATPTDLPTPSPEPTTAQLYTPAPTAIPTPTVTPAVTQAQLTTGGLNGDTLFSMVNTYRQSNGLAPLEKDDRECTLAASRAPEINNEIATGTMHSGLAARALSYWNSENIISMNSEAAAFNWWINDPIHKQAILGAYKYSCTACSGNACAQEFTNFQPK